MPATSTEPTADTLCDQPARLHVVGPRGRGCVDDEDWVGVNEAAEIVGASRWTIIRASAEDLPFRETTTGSPRRRPEREYRRADVERFKAARSARGRTLDERVADLERWRAGHERGHP